MARELKAQGQRVLIFRSDSDQIRRVPVSELITYALVEGLRDEQYSAGCPKSRDGYEDAELDT